jgi:hypothetical protein
VGPIRRSRSSIQPRPLVGEWQVRRLPLILDGVPPAEKRSVRTTDIARSRAAVPVEVAGGGRGEPCEISPGRDFRQLREAARPLQTNTAGVRQRVRRSPAQDERDGLRCAPEERNRRSPGLSRRRSPNTPHVTGDRCRGGLLPRLPRLARRPPPPLVRSGDSPCIGRRSESRITSRQASAQQAPPDFDLRRPEGRNWR